MTGKSHSTHPGNRCQADIMESSGIQSHFPPSGVRISTTSHGGELGSGPLSSLKNNRGLHHPAESAGNHYMTVAFDGRVETGYIRCSYDAITGCSASVMYFLWLVSYVTFKSCYYWSMIYYIIMAAGLPEPYRKSYMLGFTKKSCGFTVKKTYNLMLHWGNLICIFLKHWQTLKDIGGNNKPILWIKVHHK